MPAFVEYFDHILEVEINGQQAEPLVTPCAAYHCSCGHEGAAINHPAFEFPVCEHCGQMVMPEREALEVKRGD